MTLRTHEARRTLLHKRVRELYKKTLKTQLAAVSAMTGCLGICLWMLVFSAAGLSPVTGGGSFTGASLLSDDVGGYVLIAVIAFMTGVIITAVIQFYRRKKKDQQ